MTNETIQQKLEAARKASGQSSGDANKQETTKEPDTTKEPETVKEPMQPNETIDPGMVQLENIALARQAVKHTPLPEIVGADIVHEAPVVNKGPKPAGYYTTMAGSLHGARRLIKLTQTPYGAYQSFEDVEATGTQKSWDYLISKHQAEKVEEDIE